MTLLPQSCFQHLPTPSSPTFELPQHFNHVPEVAFITMGYMFLYGLKTIWSKTPIDQDFETSITDFRGLYSCILISAVLCISKTRVSTHWMPITFPLQLQPSYVYRYCQISPEGRAISPPVNNHYFRSWEPQMQEVCFFSSDIPRSVRLIANSSLISFGLN